MEIFIFHKFKFEKYKKKIPSSLLGQKPSGGKSKQTFF